MNSDLDSRPILEFRQQQLKHQINASLALLVGQLHKSPAQCGHQLRWRLCGQLRRHYVRVRLLAQVRAMIENHQRLQELIVQLSEVNWRLLQLPPEEAEPLEAPGWEPDPED